MKNESHRHIVEFISTPSFKRFRTAQQLKMRLLSMMFFIFSIVVAPTIFAQANCPVGVVALSPVTGAVVLPGDTINLSVFQTFSFVSLPPTSTVYNWTIQPNPNANAVFLPSGTATTSEISTYGPLVPPQAGLVKAVSNQSVQLSPSAQPGQIFRVTVSSTECVSVGQVMIYDLVVGTPIVSTYNIESVGSINIPPDFVNAIKNIRVRLTSTTGTITAPVANSPVAFNLVSGLAEFVGNGMSSIILNTDSNGVASTDVRILSTGPIAIHAFSDLPMPPFINPSTLTNFVEFNLSGLVPTYQFEIVGGNEQLAQSNSEFAAPLQVRVIGTDFFGTFPLDCVPVTFTIDGDASFVVDNITTGQSTFSTFTGEDTSICFNRTNSKVNTPKGSIPTGIATAFIAAGLTGGPISVSATATVGSSTFLTQTFNLTVGLPVSRSLNIVSGNGQLGTIGFDGEPLVVALSDAVSGPIPNETISWSVTGSGVTLSASSSTTAADGRAQIGIRFTGSTSQTRVTATDSTGLRADFAFGNTGTATIQLVSGNAQAGAIRTLSDQPLIFEVRGASGAPLSGVPVTFGVESGSATLNPLTATSGADGRASTRATYGSSPGAVRFFATVPGGARAQSDATVFTPDFVIVEGNNQTASAGSRLPIPLAVRVIRPAATSSAKSVAGLIVNWTVTSGSGVLSTTSSTTDANGRAQNEFTLGTSVGTNTVTATITDIGSLLFTEISTADINRATIEIVSGNAQTIATNMRSQPLVIRVKDANGAALSGVSIDWLGLPAGTVFVTSANTTTGNDGTSSNTAVIGLPGARTVEAKLSNTTQTVRVAFSINGGVANLDGLTPNQRNVAAAIDKACPSLATSTGLDAGEQDLLQRCSELVVGAGRNPNEISQALDQMLADESEAQSSAALSVASVQFDNLKARIAALRSGAKGASLGGLAVNTASGQMPLGILPAILLAASGEDEEKEIGNDFSRWGFFATGTIGRGSHDTTTNSVGFDYGSFGLTAGVDYRLTNSFILGAALGLSRNTTDINNAGGDIDSSGTSFSGYATYYKDESFYLDAVLTIGRNNFDSNRNINYTIRNVSGTSNITVDQIASASSDGDQKSFSLSLGKDFNSGAWSFGPYVRAMLTKLSFDSYQETLSNPNAPGGGLGMSVDGRDLDSRSFVVGGKLSYTMSRDWGVLIPNALFEFQKELEDDPGALTTRFINDPTGTPILISGDEVDTSYMNIGLGVSALFANGKSGYIYWEHVLGLDRVSQDSIALGFRMEF